MRCFRILARTYNVRSTIALFVAIMLIQTFSFPNFAEADNKFTSSFAELVNKAKPAVVTILTKTTTNSGAPPPITGQQVPDLPPGHPLHDFFDKFFGGWPPMGQPQQPRDSHGLGSGFIVDPSGTIVTNNHVIDGAEEIKVLLDDGTELEATLNGRDSNTDVAVLKVSSNKPLPTVPWGNSDMLEVGDWVIAIGNPFGLGGTVTSGIVSARGRDIHAGPYDDFIQIDAAINRGNSGGPLFNIDGQVVGMNTAIFSPNGANIGLGFSVPSNQARAVVSEILEHGAVERGFIGVRIQPITADIATSLGLLSNKGALVADVDPSGPAGQGGLKVGDVILRCGKIKIEEVRDLTRAIANTDPGNQITLIVWRYGREREIKIRVNIYPKDDQLAQATTGISDSTVIKVPNLGITLSDEPQGAVILSVSPDSAEELRPGDIITAVGQDKVSKSRQVSEAINRAKSRNDKLVLLLVRRGDQQHYVTLQLLKK
ncbi:Do family serine endopeptidase [Candidatus Endolissoclinum faulkneri]|nr:Do family serine endopeptidase [Candidatus Endolissoclinum faulkneri]